MTGRTKAERLADIHTNRRQAAKTERNGSGDRNEISGGTDMLKQAAPKKPSMIQSMLRSQLDQKLGKD